MVNEGAALLDRPVTLVSPLTFQPAFKGFNAC